ncbi:hypothetical protein HNP48_006392 [Acidovorax soli]|uniref:Bacteriophage tail tape measure N-terminal domain-containing protein n=1 Tax=Acidovorax soli TaxID=592050 RepID=A0A7X0UD07_9BURK|nr:phage tail length tape measure family protein [Acidovorax soli]MBB6563668.1 hypothetical protein [Acidovorax soli]
MAIDQTADAVQANAQYLAQGQAMVSVAQQIEQAVAGQLAVFGSMQRAVADLSSAMQSLPGQLGSVISALQSGSESGSSFLEVSNQIVGTLADSSGAITNAGLAFAAYSGLLGAAVAPFTMVAAAVAGLSIAYHEGSKESVEYAKAIAQTGNAAGTRVSELQAMAVSVSSVVGTQAKAAEALTALVGSGQVGVASLEQFAATAVLMERNVGVSIKDTVRAFAELGESPVEASRRLNAQHNYLTSSVYDQIKALEDQGLKTQAATLAQQTYDAAMVKTSKTVEDRLGYLAKAWRGVSDGAKEAWDKMLNLGRPATVDSKLAAAQEQLETTQRERWKFGSGESGEAAYKRATGVLQQRIALLQDHKQSEQAAASEEANKAASERKLIDAGDSVDRRIQAAKPSHQRRKEELEEFRKEQAIIAAKHPKDKRLDKSTVAMVEAHINAQFQSGGAKGSSGEDASGLEIIKQKIAAEKEYIESLGKRGTAQEKLSEGAKLEASIQKELDKGNLSARARAQKERELEAARELTKQNALRAAKEAEISAQSKAEEELKKYAESASKAAEGIGKAAEAQEALNKAFGKSKTEAEKDKLDGLKQARNKEADEGPPVPGRLEAMDKTIAQQERYVSSLVVADFQAIGAQADALLKTAREQSELAEKDAQMTGLSAVERAKLVALRQVELKYAKELEKLEKLPEGTEKDAARNKLNEAKRIEGETAVAKVVREDWQKTADQINTSLTDAFMKSLESGKDFGKNLREALKEQFKNLVLKPTISTMMKPVSGALSSFVTTIMGGSNSPVSPTGANSGIGGDDEYGGDAQIGNLMTVVQAGYQAYTNTGLVGAIAKAFGIGGSTGAGAGAGAAAGAGGLGATGWGVVLAVLANAMGFFRSKNIVGSGLQGTLGRGDLSAWEEERTGGTLVSGSSFETTDPIARYRELKRRDQEAIARFKAEGATGGASVTYNGQPYDRTLAASSTLNYGTYDEDMERMIGLVQAQSDGIQKGYNEFRKNLVGMANDLGLAGGKIADFTFDLSQQDLNFQGLDEAKIQEKITAAYGKAGAGMAKEVLGRWITETVDVVKSTQLSQLTESSDALYDVKVEQVTRKRYEPSEYAKAGETAFDTLKRLATSFNTLNEASDALGFGIHQGSLALADFADDFIEAFGGLERFTASTGAFLQNYYSDEERRQYLASSGSRRLEKLGINVSAEQLLGATGNDIKNAVNSLVSDPDLYGDVMDVANYIAPLYQGAAQAAPAVENLSNAVDELTQKFTGAKDALLNDAKSLAVELLRAQGKEGQAKALERQNYLAGFSDLDEGRRQELATQYDANEATRRAIDVQNERNGLQNELNALTDDATQALTRQRDALDESNRALFDNVQAVKLQKTIAEELPGVLSKYMLPAQRRKAQYEGTAAELTAAGIHVTGDQLANASKEQFAAAAMSVYNLGSTTDGMRLALVRAAGAIADIKDAEVDEAFANVQRMVAAQQEQAEETKARVKAVFDLVKSSVDELYSEVDSTMRMRAAEGQDVISKALATAQRTGKLIDAEELGKAISAARQGLDGTQYTSQFERDRDRLVLAGKLSDLEEISGEQLSEAEAQLEELERISDQAQLQIDELKGIHSGVGDVNKALQDLTDAINGKTNSVATTRPSNVITGRGEASFNMTTGRGTTEDGVEFERQAIWNAAREVLAAAPDGSGAMSVYNALAAGGYTLAQYNAMFGMPAGTLEQEAQKLGMKVFHRGTPFVPNTGFALLQRGEAVIPTAYNPFVHGRSLGDTARLEAHLEKLTGEVMRLQSLQTLGNTHAQATVELLDNVTEGGNGIRAEIMNKVELVA